MIRRKIPWTRQPQSPVKVDRGNPDNDGLTYFVSPYTGGFSIDPAFVVSASSAVSRVITPYGVATNHPVTPTNPTLSVDTGAIAVWQPNYTVAIAVVCTAGNVPNTNGILTSALNYFGLYFTSGTDRTIRLKQWNGSATSTGYTLPSDGSLVVLTLIIITGASRLYANGVLVYTSADSNTWSVGGLYIGHIAGTFDSCNPVKILWTAAWSKILPLSKILDNASNKAWIAFAPQTRNIFVSVAGGGVSAALTGQAITVAQGTASPTVSTTLTGQQTDISQGTASPTVSTAITGQSITAAQGSVAPTVSTAITGQAVSIAQGTVTKSVGGATAALTGQAISIAQGAVASVVRVALTGQAISIAQGTVAVAAATYGDVYNAAGYFTTGGTVTISLYNPITGAAISLSSNACPEIGTTGVYIWDTTKLTAQPSGYQEYAYKMSNGTTFSGGVMIMAITAQAIATAV